ncbi:MAG: ATP synthase F1 subunit epsilon [Bdellovibrionales bacterium]|nr:ATP synthase F1 subunit epsilon [Bdellovibrionales bacterium]
MKYYTVDILTPSKIIARAIPAESLLIPTVRGQINVLENHTHIVSKLSTGVLTVFGGPDYADRNFIVTGGVCKILENKITILANAAEESTDVNVERAKLSLQNAEERLKNTEGLSHEEVDEYVQKAERARLRIQLAEFTRPH